VTVFGVLGEVVAAGCRPLWYHVELPLRPNGITGYVRAADVAVGRVQTRIVVDLSQRLVTLYRAGRAVLRARSAIGAPATPTPTGRFFVNQRIIAGNPSGPWGPAALGISAFSPTERSWVQGGPIAIHGTNEPWSIGHAASHGCIRVANDVLTRLFRETPAGTPVLIRA
jgi:lipoprotein-anchoring transpeptidase ErfK/SrfK